MVLFQAEKISVRPLLIVAALLAGLAPSILITLGSGVAIRDLIGSQSLETKQILAQSLARQYESFLNEHLHGLEQAATSLGKAPQFGPEAAQTQLDTFTSVFKSFANAASVTDAQGQTIATAAKEANALSINYADRQWFQRARDERKAIADRSVIASRRTGDLIVVLAAPVLSPSGAFLGAISAGLDLRILQQAAENLRYGRSGTAQVASMAGTAIVHNDKELVSRQFDFSREEIWAAMGNRKTGRVESYIGFGDKERFAGFDTVDQTGWRIWVSENRDDIEKDVWESYGAVGWSVGIALIVVALLAALLARFIAKPVETLTDTADDIAKGDLTKRAELAGPKEMVALAGAVNAMAANLQEKIETEQRSRRSIQSVVQEFGALAAKVTEGDLTGSARIPDDPELSALGHGINMMIRSLSELVDEIKEASTRLASASTEILAATSQQVAATQEESTAVKQTATTVAEVRQTAELVSSRAQSMAALVKKASEVSAEGRRSVDESIASSELSKSSMESLAQRILDLSDHVQSVAEINMTVKDLAEQSNLLAVNAEIEAAKAGEAGKGFAVVATEVKVLADQCKEATAQVRGILKDIQRATQAAMLSAEKGVRAAENSVAIANRSGDAIRMLTQNVTEGSDAAQQILASTQQQSIGMDQITDAMENIQRSTEQTVAATSQVEASARELTSLSSRLTELVTSVNSGESGRLRGRK
ncbi:methyl-accepting chemotaxis protein [Oceanibaculum pacificum]|uniref:Chemotaxis protein n=1 Tax=Oceanibaculum pacificum TaxID=580166 RepID=A0A154VY93_9PROT|nr:methyl-accepting chemotaxis protein [Oceanibaculum pacificum]KZD06197.1 hypothetical protein AUP43_11165 [Oceanibaculum pacificum]